MSDHNAQPEDDQYFEDDNLAFLPADHPLLARLQAALYKQLSEEHERVDLELIEREGVLKKIEREKENVGVQLYGSQQSLAEMQQTYEQTHENYNFVQKLRMEAEQKLSQLNETYISKKNEIDDLGGKYIKAMDELSKLNRTLKQIEKYNEDMKGLIGTTKRTAYRAEENVVGLEKEKKKQDFLIDYMNEEIKRLTEQKYILEAQLKTQQEETEAARNILKDASAEIEKIKLSKNNLLERWQKSLLEMQRRDRALQTIKDALKDQADLNVQLQTELNGINHEIEREKDRQEGLLQDKTKLENEKRTLEAEKHKIEHEQKKLQSQYHLLNQSLKTTEEETKKIEAEVKIVEENMLQIESNIMKLHSESKALMEEILDKISQQKTMEKTKANLYKQVSMIEIQNEEREIEMETLENEIARVRIDQLNTQAQIELLQQKKREVSRERKEKEETVAKYEVEIRQGHDINEKKQHEVGKLNKIHDDLKNNQEVVASSAPEATKFRFKRETKEMQEQCEMLKHDFIKKQTALVNHFTRLNQLEEETSSLRTKGTILEQKKLRLNNNQGSHEKEIKSIGIALKELRHEMNKLNDGLSKNQSMKMKLEHENYNIESEFVEKLKELEKDSVRLEVKIDKLKEEKADLLSEIVEAERQILLWERKIQLEKEMQEALDPNIGQSELQQLKKELHRMELRLEELRKKQDQLIQEIERTIEKRESIQFKYTNKDKVEASGSATLKKKSSVKQPQTTTQVSKQVNTLKTTLNQTLQNAKQIEGNIKQLRAEGEQINKQIESLNDRLSGGENRLFEMNFRLNEKKLTKLVNIYKISELQNRARKLEDVAANKARLSYPEEVLKTKYDDVINYNTKLKNVFQDFVQNNSEWGPILEQLINL